jgi:type IV pilus assembly protein PilB
MPPILRVSALKKVYGKKDPFVAVDGISFFLKPGEILGLLGPNGSGKTTTLYTLMSILNSPEISIVTIEDPIEYAISCAKQIQVNPKTGLTFANGLRSILRQDPNIITVGEIRDSETARIATNTALTGHLLLSTLHTNDASTTLPRLLDMGIEPYLVASTVRIAIGQRLVRKICIHCKEKNILASQHFSTHSYHGKGCVHCHGSGYSGRISINEVLVSTEAIRTAIINKASASELRLLAQRNGMTTMFQDGMKKVESGQTTTEEVLRVIHEE